MDDARDYRRELLPKSEWQYWFCPANECVQFDRIVVGCFVKGPERCLSYEQFAISDLPNDYVPLQELECILSNLLDRVTVRRFEQMPSYRACGLAVPPDLF
jgi:hypothetical protein